MRATLELGPADGLEVELGAGPLPVVLSVAVTGRHPHVIDDRDGVLTRAAALDVYRRVDTPDHLVPSIAGGHLHYRWAPQARR